MLIIAKAQKTRRENESFLAFLLCACLFVESGAKLPKEKILELGEIGKTRPNHQKQKHQSASQSLSFTKCWYLKSRDKGLFYTNAIRFYYYSNIYERLLHKQLVLNIFVQSTSLLIIGGLRYWPSRCCHW